MGGRLIRGFFIGGSFRAPGPAPQPAAPGRRAGGSTTPGPPQLAFAGPAAAAQPSGGDSFAIDPAQLGLARGGGKPLPPTLLAKMEAAFGADFSGVRIHIGPQASRIGAVAFATGNDLYFAPGGYQPDSVQGQQLIGHELAHVIQQRQGRVRAPGVGIAVVNDLALEAEADRLGIRAASHRGPCRTAPPRVAAPFAGGILQRHPIETVEITGLTHLRESNLLFDSLVHGTDFAEVRYPETVSIDLGDVWESRLGMNLARSDRPRNLWYRALSYRGQSLRNRNIYLRSGMFRPLSPLGRMPPHLRQMIAENLDIPSQLQFSLVEKATSVHGLTASRNQWSRTHKAKPPWAQSGSRHGARMAQEDVVIRQVASHFALVPWDKGDGGHVALRDARASSSGKTPDYVVWIDGEFILGDTFTFMLPVLITNQLGTMVDEAKSKMQAYSGRAKGHRPRVFVAINFVNYFLVHIRDGVVPILAQQLAQPARDHGAIVVLVARDGFMRLF